MFDKNLRRLAKILKEKNLKIASAESCTGGLLASRLTDIDGSSAYLDESHITYANFAKHKYLGVSEGILENFGAVSKECACAMAEGLQKLSNCDIAVCTTGIAGPKGGSKEKPVGLIYISVRYKDITSVKKVTLNPLIPRKIMKFLFTQKAIDFAYSILAD